MHGNIRGGPIAAIKIGDSTGGKSADGPIPIIRKSVVERRRVVVESALGWFVDACKRLLPREKPGPALVCDTGFDLRDCERYAAGDVKPSAYFVRALLRSENGWTWLNAIMDGASPAWWVEIQRARRIAEAIRESDHA